MWKFFEKNTMSRINVGDFSNFYLNLFRKISCRSETCRKRKKIKIYSSLLYLFLIVYPEFLFSGGVGGRLIIHWLLSPLIGFIAARVNRCELTIFKRWLQLQRGSIHSQFEILLVAKRKLNSKVKSACFLQFFWLTA